MARNSLTCLWSGATAQSNYDGLFFDGFWYWGPAVGLCILLSIIVWHPFRFILTRELSQSKGQKTSKQLADLEEKRSSLIRQIQIWRPIQVAYTPHVATLLPLVDSVDEPGSQYTHPKSAPLCFPSSLPSEIRRRAEMKEMCDAERRLWEPQADDALADVHWFRRTIQGLWQFKKLNVSGTGNKPNTWMLDLYNRIDYKLQRAANQYRIAYAALMALDPNGSWREHLKELNPVDIRGPRRDPDHPEDAKTSSGRFILSWMWLVFDIMNKWSFTLR